MKNENQEFLDKYKQLDNYIKDKRNTESGITDYINDLEKINKKSKYSNYLKILKDLRYKRNMLAHEISIDSKYITSEDIKYLNAFTKLVTNKQDPLSKKKVRKHHSIDTNELKLKLFPILLGLLLISIIINIILILK